MLCAKSLPLLFSTHFCTCKTGCTACDHGRSYSFSVLQCCNRHCIFLLFSFAFCYHCSECAHSTLFWRTDHYLVTRTATLSVWGREDVVICHLLFRSSSTTPVHRIGVVPYACKLQLMISTNRSGVGSEAPQTECKPVPMLTLIAWQQT